ncbi:MAG: diguanylate cyclase [Candidatus Omnitrophica bacterium]|nr:diguanylate cyclase [Candidatus Omnitrophota bacterium]
MSTLALTTDFIDDLPLILFGVNSKGEVTLVNKVASDVTGYTKEEINGVKINTLIPDLYKNEKKSKYKSIQKKEITLTTKFGDKRTIVWNSYETSNTDQKDLVYVFTGNDITTQKLWEQNKDHNSEYIKTTKNRLKKYLTLDPHTGLLNFRHFMNKINNLFYEHLQNKKDLSILLINLDYFDSVNSTHGYSFGNKIIHNTAQLIKNNIEENFIAGRFSGNEFAIIMPSTSIQKAFDFSGKLFSKLNNHNFFINEKLSMPVNISVSMSLGGVPYCHDVATPSQMIDRVAEELNSSKSGATQTIKMCAKEKIIQEKDAISTAISNNEFRYTMEFVNALATAVKIKDCYTQEHSISMTRYALSMAYDLGLSETEANNVRIGAMLHDIGKIGIDKMILLKPASLTQSEMKAIQQHPIIGAEIIRNVHPLKDVVPYVKYHHERYDGAGYLTRISGEEIPLGARIISLADVFQALTSNRPYRKAMKEKDAFEIIKRGTGKHFDPKVVKSFFNVYSS